VIRRGGAGLGGDADARAWAELIRVDSRAEARRNAGPQDGAGLVGVEGTALAEDIDPPRVTRAAGTTCAPRNVVSGVKSLATASERASSRTVNPYPLLISTVVVPCAAISATCLATLAASASSLAARVAATVVRMPPAEYGSPRIRAANSRERSPAKTRCAWLSTNPGMTAAPATSTSASAAGA
jgi:hypothetical protein